jgi:hypothetical protein
MFKITKVTILLLLLLGARSYAQISIYDTKKLDRFKDGQTYVMVKNTNFPGADKFLQEMQKGWTLTKGIRYLLNDGTAFTVKPNDSFLNLEALTVRINSTVNVNYHLSFWICKEKFFKKDRALKQSDEEPIATVSLSVDPSAFSANSFFKNTDFDGGGLIYNWSPGMLKNYLQQMTSLLQNKKETTNKEITKKAELKNLSKDTLYVADFNLIHYNAFTGQAKQRDEETVADIFEKYKSPYKVISKGDLDKMITDDKKPFYYLLFIKSSSTKEVCVINSKTGETVYSRFTNISYNLKS